jgi:hypothetical protein
MKALEMEDAARVVAFADGASEFCEQITICLGQDVQNATGARREAVAAYSWDELFTRLDVACAEALAS